MPDHPLLRRMHPEQYSDENNEVRPIGSRRRQDSWGRTVSQSNQQHPLVHKSPWVRNAEENKLPAKDMTNG